MRRVLVMVVSELRQRLTDGSVLAFAVIVPLALMYVMNLIFSSATEAELEPITVAVAAPEGDQLAAVIPQVLGSVDEGGMQVTVRDASAPDVPSLVEDGTVGMGVVVPDGFTEALTSGDGPQVQVTLGDDAGLSGVVVSSVLDGVLTQLTASTRAVVAALDLGVPPQQAMAVAQGVSAAVPEVVWQQGAAADEQLGAEESVVAGQAGLFLLFTVGFGVLGLVAERDQGTLARLVSMPMRPWLIVLSKGLVSFVLGLVATSVLLGAGGLLFNNVDFGSPVAVGALVVMVVAAATSIMFIIAKVARTAEQAGIAQAIVAVVLGMSGGAFFPTAATGWLGQLMALNPVKSFSNGLGITSGGGGLAELAPIAGTMTAFTVVCLVLAWLLPDRKDVL